MTTTTMTLDQAYTRAVATLQGLVQKFGATAIGYTYMNMIRETENDWNARHPELADVVEVDEERANCPQAGELGHWQCGMCAEHDQPRYLCGCVYKVKSVTKYQMDDATFQSLTAWCDTHVVEHQGGNEQAADDARDKIVAYLQSVPRGDAEFSIRHGWQHVWNLVMP